MTCTCNGFGRNFIKSMGACLCKKGFKPKNDAPNEDSSEDCEAIVKQVCAENQEITVDGQCLTSDDDEEKYCNRYCPATGGFVVPGTGMCECNSLNMPEETCNADCQKTRPKAIITKDGNVKLDNGDSVAEIDPTEIEGYQGNFKPESPAGLDEGKAHFIDVGENFSFDYSLNDNLLDSVGLEDNADRSTSQQKLFFGMFFQDPWQNFNDKGRNRRAL